MYLNFNDPKTGLINAVTGKIIYNSIVNVEKSYELRKNYSSSKVVYLEVIIMLYLALL